MSVQTLQDPGEVLQVIESGKPTIIHYWDPQMGPESPLAPMFYSKAEDHDGLSIYIVDSGFIHPEHSPDELPLTVFYLDGIEVDAAAFDPSQIEGLFQRNT
ncbi:hypothetical protein ANOM_008866 [Aspergillus nomiae NRRL 13137]|uniref:Uncharacterized protein n=1 Tax=Aspergillus nomiae NRRL (strain ATCC 15546 / NRRL 13137 / CBS 260.88 / M93) TaxID=1509407 RepID=A0A0L1IR44_ASPN3|nr:uncharacterized protein ANOM_008866 [Aspergillus nomiae NRRL 13137]KNG81947.1 hypothetical protein ANOM_008866 [Aspergillus nomiae NRRL 13137]